MTSFMKFSIICLAFLVITGCATYGEEFNFEEMDSIQKGMNREDVRGLLVGDPISRINLENGSFCERYLYSNTSFFSTKSKAIDICYKENIVFSIWKSVIDD